MVPPKLIRKGDVHDLASVVIRCEELKLFGGFHQNMTDWYNKDLDDLALRFHAISCLKLE